MTSCGCGVQLKIIRFEDEDDLVFCPGCTNASLIAQFTGMGQGIEDYNGQLVKQ